MNMRSFSLPLSSTEVSESITHLIVANGALLNAREFVSIVIFTKSAVRHFKADGAIMVMHNVVLLQFRQSKYVSIAITTYHFKVKVQVE